MLWAPCPAGRCARLEVDDNQADGFCFRLLIQLCRKHRHLPLPNTAVVLVANEIVHVIEVDSAWGELTGWLDDERFTLQSD